MTLYLTAITVILPRTYTFEGRMPIKPDYVTLSHLQYVAQKTDHDAIMILFKYSLDLLDSFPLGFWDKYQCEDSA